MLGSLGGSDVDLERGGTHHISKLQILLRAAHSNDVMEQQQAALNLSLLVEGTLFPVVSYGPLVHALCRLVPSSDRTTVRYAARAVKILLCDDALRGQVDNYQMSYPSICFSF